MALRYRVMVVAYGKARAAGFPDFCDYEAARDCRRVQEADGRIYSIVRIDVPTGTTPAQDELMRRVRGVRWHERRLRSMHRSTCQRLEMLEQELEAHLARIDEAVSRQGAAFRPRDEAWHEFFLLVEDWMEWRRTLAQARRLLARAHDCLVPPDGMPVTPGDVEALAEGRDECERRIDDFIRRYDTALQ